MPIQEKDLGKYKRPAIYINEIDNSMIELPLQDVLINLVPGFSKKGTFNKPVYVDNTVDFERIYGTIDKQLENKGSYFHRTCEKMLETGPIWALNLLSTVPNRDVLNYVSVSTSSAYKSSDFSNQYTADYEKFFNRQDFWTRDEDSFQDLVDETGLNPDNLLSLTNMGTKTITAYIYKSDITGFDVTCSTWYGGDTKVPTYLDPKSLISDYMVTVLVLAGDWTDYKTLSSDTTWSKYFTLNGLIIDTIQDFVNETGVEVLNSVDVSLIPNFKDLNDRDMYIESVINNNTDKTNLFCTYNQDLLLDSDYLTNYIDLIGGSIVGDDTITSINFLSYNQTIKEMITYPQVELDSPNNVFGTTDSVFGTETHEYNNWTQMGIYTGSTSFSASPLEFNYDIAVDSQYIINGVVYSGLTSSGVTLSSLSDGYKRLDVLYLDSTGFHVMDGTAVLVSSSVTPKSITFTNSNTIILGTLLLIHSGGTYYNGGYTEITKSNDYVPILTSSGYTGSESYLRIEFLGTSGLTIRNNEYERLRRYKVYNEVATNLAANKGVIISSTSLKTSIIDPSCNGYTSTSNAFIDIYIDTPSLYTNGSNGVIIFYVDKQFKLNSSLSANTPIITTNSLTQPNIVAKYSDFYEDFYDGVINTGDVISGTTGKLTMYIDTLGNMTITIDADITDTTNGLSVYSNIGNWRQTVEIESFEGNDLTNIVAIKINKNRYSEITRDLYLEAYYDEDAYSAPYGEQYILGNTVPRKLVRIINIKNDTSDTNLKILYTDGPIKISYASGTTEMYTTCYPSIYNYATYLKGINLKPFVIHQDSIPNGTEARLNTILDVIAKDTPMYKGLKNKNKISWRYLVDSFGLGLQENSKQQYVDLCGDKMNCFGFINMPSVKQFKKSSNPSFIDDVTGALSTEYIKEGANPDKNPDFLYSFGTGNGRSTVGYFFPYVKVTTDNVSSFVPPAAYVASAYMRKFTTSIAGTNAWTIVAGINMGRVPDISGTEMDFTDDDLDNFSDMGCNPITYIRNIGYIINDENTAQVYPVSSLSYIHSREVLIELEDQLYDMLLRYQWKFNTPTIRSEIKYRADKICQSFVDSNGLYTFKNIIDTTNNTNYIIDLQGGVLDTYVEITKGLGWIVNNITIEKTGTINSTGFQA